MINRKIANERHNLKNQLVKLKAQDDLHNRLLYQIDNSNETPEQLLQKIKNSIQSCLSKRVITRKYINDRLDNMERINPKEK
ncbi:hypothetical protein [uncultured Mediterranean phage]|nr:hypothetical protein [uncultured Mediterranean phage]